MNNETLEVKKEFILEAYEAACGAWKSKIKKELPQLFERFKAGDWVVPCKSYGEVKKGKPVQLIRPQAPCGTFWVVNHTMWSDTRESRDFLAPPSATFRFATIQEVSNALKEDAKKRGLERGVSYRCVDTNGIEKLRGEFIYYPSSDSLTDGYGGYVYRKGKWADRVDVMTKAEAEERLNCLIKG